MSAREAAREELAGRRLWYNAKAWQTRGCEDGVAAIDHPVVGVSVLGSTGSIGEQTLDVIEKSPGLRVVALAAGSNAERLARQVRRHRPKLAVIADERKAAELKKELPPDVRLAAGPEGLVEAAVFEEASIVVTGVVGAAGLHATAAALRAGKRVALANKESLVAGGEAVMQIAAQSGEIVPVDGEHCGLFQCLQGLDGRDVSSLILTASGGPFLRSSVEEMARATPSEALAHPTWRMGGKISVDSATLMNKGLEVLEARWLFQTPLEKIRVLIHPQSIVHALVEVSDGSMLAQLSVTDMRLAISYALHYPKRGPKVAGSLDLASVGRLEFEEPDVRRFPALGLAYEAGRVGGTLPAVLNAANEVAVQAFLREEIGFLEIIRVVEQTMQKHQVMDATLEQVLEADRWARRQAEQAVRSPASKAFGQVFGS